MTRIFLKGRMEDECYNEALQNCSVTGKKDNFGGHTMALADFESYNIQGVELTNMGQTTVLGRQD